MLVASKAATHAGRASRPSSPLPSRCAGREKCNAWEAAISIESECLFRFVVGHKRPRRESPRWCMQTGRQGFRLYVGCTGKKRSAVSPGGDGKTPAGTAEARRRTICLGGGREAFVESAGLKVVSGQSVPVTYHYEDMEKFIRVQMSSGPSQIVIGIVGEEKI